MVELAARDGMPPPSGLPDGQCIITRLEDGSLRIDRADPRILISAELLDEARCNPARGVSLKLPGGSPPGGYLGSALRVEAVNRVLIYRVTEYVPRVHGYIAEWPD